MDSLFLRRAAALAVAMIAVLPAPREARASSHREAPGIAENPVADNTDTYAFVSPTNPDAVTLIGCWWPLEEAAGGPNYYHFGDNVDYAIHVDNDGDANEDLTFLFRFRTQFMNPNTSLYATGEIGSLGDPDWNYRQTYEMRLVEDGRGIGSAIASDLIVPPVNIGPRTTPNYEALVAPAIYALSNGMKVFAGQRDDPFFVDLGAVFDLLGFRAVPGNMGQGVDGLGGYNCQAICLEVPIAMLTRDGSNPSDPASPAAVIGVWATSGERLPRSDSPRNVSRPISRLGMPLVNEVVIPIGQKDTWNRSHPKDDAQFALYVIDPELPRLIEALYGVTAPPTPRCDLVTIFLTGIPGLNQPPNVVPSEEIRLNVAIKPDANPDSRFGLLGGDLDGFPNGRRLADDVVDIEERAVAGAVYPLLCGGGFTPHPLAGSLGDGVDVNDQPFLETFPYVATPHQGWEHPHHRIEGMHPPEKAEPAAIGTAASSVDRFVQPAPKTSSPARFSVGAFRPNPTRGASELAFSLAREAQVTMRVFDVSGREVKTLVNGTLPAGSHEARWDGTDTRGSAVAAGVYLLRLEVPGESADRKIMVVK